MHEGHRKRMMEKLTIAGALRDSEILEILLFFVCPRRDVSGAAKNLIGVFGDLAGVLNADVAALSAVDGVGKNMAEYLVCTSKAIKHLSSDERDSFGMAGTLVAFRKFMCERYLGDNIDPIEVDVIGRDFRILRILPMKDYRSLSRSVLSIKKMNRVRGIALSIYRHDGGSCARTVADDEYEKEIINVCDICGISFIGWGICGDDGFLGQLLPVGRQ